MTALNWRQSFGRGAMVFLWTSLAAFAGLVLLRFYSGWVAESDTFRVRRVDIRGSELLSTREILELGGISETSRIWQYDLGTIEKRLESYPFIADARVTRRFPDILAIEIREKEPVALLNVHGTFFCVDQDGLILPSRPGRLYDLPVITGDFEGGVDVGVRAGGAHLRSGLGFLRTILKGKPEIYNRISEIVVGKPEGIILHTQERGIPVWMGEGDYIRKGCCLEAVMDELRKNRNLHEVKYIDLRFQGQVVVGMRV